MNKLFAVSAATLVAVTAIASGAAEAGFNLRIKAPAGFADVHQTGCHGGGGSRRAAQSFRRSKPRVALASRAARKSTEVAKAESAKPAQTVAAVEEKADVAQVENSSVSGGKVAAVQPAEKVVDSKPADKTIAAVPVKKPEQKVVASARIGCKKFIPGAGLTITVPCEAK